MERAVRNFNLQGEGKAMEEKKGERDSRGFSLIEMMIALFILSVSILALLSLTLTSIQVNMRNDIRNTAIRLTNQTAEILLVQPIGNVVSGGLRPYDATNAALSPNFNQYPDPDPILRGSKQAYTVTWVVSNLTNDLRQITITVQYNYKGTQYTNSTVVYKHRAV